MRTVFMLLVLLLAACGSNPNVCRVPVTPVAPQVRPVPASITAQYDAARDETFVHTDLLVVDDNVGIIFATSYRGRVMTRSPGRVTLIGVVTPVVVELLGEGVTISLDGLQRPLEHLSVEFSHVVPRPEGMELDVYAGQASRQALAGIFLEETQVTATAAEHEFTFDGEDLTAVQDFLNYIAP